MAGDQLEFGDDERSVALKRAWERALYSLASKVNKPTLESYIRPIRPLSFQEQTVTLGVASAFAREWLDKRYGVLIRSTLEAILGCPIELRFSILQGEERSLLGDTARAVVEEQVETPPQEAPAPKKGARNPPAPPFDESISLPLNEKYTFENFVVGKSNRLAQAGAMAVATSPGKVYNPLFLYGGPGLGKTHLLHAIGHATHSRNGGARCALVDGELFTHQYVTALRERTMDDFRRNYRSVDIWLVDDIQSVAGREQTKEEFFHTFNALYQTGKQIVIASDRSPRELRTMDERLRSRFESGLIADIASPELETREAILERRCQLESWEVPQEVTSHIASAIQSNIRALEGALTKLVAYSSIMQSPITIALAQSVLGEYFIEKSAPGQMRKTATVEAILQAAAERFGMSVEALRSQRRDKDIALARQVAMYLCRELTETALSQIGAAIGGRDHATVQRASGKVEALLEYDKSLQFIVQEIRQKLNNSY